MTLPIAEESPSAATLLARRAQEMVEELRGALSIRNDVQIVLVVKHPLVFSVEPMPDEKDRFVLSMDMRFLLSLDEDELRAALAHELGHVWIFTHHPFLQTERLANDIGQRVVDRGSFERVYTKLWSYEGTTGVSMDQLLGPNRNPTPNPVAPLNPLPALNGARP